MMLLFGNPNIKQVVCFDKWNDKNVKSHEYY